MAIPKFEVLSLTVLNDAGALKAFASVSLSGLITINEIRVCKNSGEPARALLPQKSFVDQDGTRRFSTLVEFQDRSWRAALSASVLEAWHDHPAGIVPVEKVQQAPPTTFRNEVRRRAGLAEQA